MQNKAIILDGASFLDMGACERSFEGACHKALQTLMQDLSTIEKIEPIIDEDDPDNNILPPDIFALDPDEFFDGFSDFFEPHGRHDKMIADFFGVQDNDAFKSAIRKARETVWGHYDIAPETAAFFKALSDKVEALDAHPEFCSLMQLCLLVTERKWKPRAFEEGQKNGFETANGGIEVFPVTLATQTVSLSWNKACFGHPPIEAMFAEKDPGLVLANVSNIGVENPSSALFITCDPKTAKRAQASGMAVILVGGTEAPDMAAALAQVDGFLAFGTEPEQSHRIAYSASALPERAP